MDLGLNGKVALVSGSSRGIGFAVACEFLQEGCHVVMNARDELSLQRAAQAIGCKDYEAADVTHKSECDRLIGQVVKHFGRMDILVCNVGSGKSAKAGTETITDWAESIEINLYSTTNLVEAAFPELKRARGAIVCISSICGLGALGAPITYSVAKAALNAYVKNSSRVFGRLGVRINAVAPGNILFSGSTWESKLALEKEAVEKMLETQVSLGRLGAPQEISGIVAFLASERASFITGGIFVADGGQLQS